MVVSCEHLFVNSQGSACMRLRRALDRANVTEALSGAGELQFVGLAEALELTVLLADGDAAKHERAAVRRHARFAYETKNVDIRASRGRSCPAHGNPGEPTGSLSAGRVLRPAAKPRAMRRGPCPLGERSVELSQTRPAGAERSDPMAYGVVHRVPGGTTRPEDTTFEVGKLQQS